MILVDSHCHLDRIDLTPYDGELSGAIKAAKANSVKHMLCVCIDLNNFPKVLEIAHAYDSVTASVGIHPNEPVSQEVDVEELVEKAQDPKIVAIGETGLDYYRSEGDLEWQRERFRQHIRAARASRKPLIIHSRAAREDTLKIMREENAADVGGVMHCFTETWEMAKLAMDLNFLISFSGIITFKNAQELRDVAKRVPLDRLLVETDSPYLAPVPYRGKTNEPAYVRFVAECLAELHAVDLEILADKTTQNFFQYFKAE